MQVITRESAIRGILAFLVILFLMPLGHAFVVLMERYMTGTALKLGAGALGGLGIVMAIAGNRLPGEAMKILAGVFGAILFWGGWVEFIYICYAHSIGVPPLMDGNVVYTKPEYLIMPTSIPFAALTFIIYLFMADTRWGVIIALRKWLGISENTVARNIGTSISAFIELILLIWWAYLILLIEFDPGLLGVKHPLTMIFATVCLIVGLILFVRSLSSPNWGTALRQAIVTVCVLWTYIEVMIKLKLFTEIWIYPERYIVEMIALVFAFIAVIFIIAKTGHKNIKKK